MELNELVYRTTNNFKVNNINVDIDIPTYDDIKLFDNKDIKQEIVNKELPNRIGLPINKYINIDIDTDDKELILEYDFDQDNKNLIANININTKDNTNKHIYIILKSLDDSINFSYININTTVNKSSLNISYINLLNKNSNSFISYNNNVLGDDSLLINNHLDIGGNININNYYSELIGYRSTNYLNTLYIGNDNNIIDYNSHIKNIGISTESNMRTEGILDGHAYKQHVGIVDFIEGSKKSKGEELENCILLSDTAISKSAPLLMCHEEDVEGAHGVSTGKIDKDKLFYLMAHGYSEKEANKIIIYANFNRIIGCMTNEEIKTMLYDYLDEIL